MQRKHRDMSNVPVQRYTFAGVPSCARTVVSTHLGTSSLVYGDKSSFALTRIYSPASWLFMLGNIYIVVGNIKWNTGTLKYGPRSALVATRRGSGCAGTCCATIAAFCKCWPRYGTISVDRDPQITSPVVLHFILATTVVSVDAPVLSLVYFFPVV